MGTSLNKKSVDPAVDYEKFAEDVGRAAYLKLRAHEQREKGRSSGDRTAKDKGAPNTSLLAGRALMENEKKAQDDAETRHKVAASKEVDDDDTSDSESGK
ncbi:hypothetical protein E4U36_001452 [Claviceps purpurea]|nr:hypothetical protein E4U36_001452 [Claviceps purpurea]